MKKEHWSFYLHVGRHNIDVDGKVVGQIWTKEDAARVCDAMNAQTKVTFPNPEAKKINDALGIPDERHEEIVEALLRAYESAPDAFKVSDIIKDMLDMVNITSANEALYLGMLIGKAPVVLTARIALSHTVEIH